MRRSIRKQMAACVTFSKLNSLLLVSVMFSHWSYACRETDGWRLDPGDETLWTEGGMLT